MTSYDDLDAQLAALQATLKVEVQKVKIDKLFLLNYKFRLKFIWF